jgi:hypothetical protein
MTDADWLSVCRNSRRKIRVHCASPRTVWLPCIIRPSAKYETGQQRYSRSARQAARQMVGDGSAGAESAPANELDIGKALEI